MKQFQREASDALSLPRSPTVPALLEELVKKEKTLDVSVPEKETLKKARNQLFLTECMRGGGGGEVMVTFVKKLSDLSSASML